VLSLTLSSLYVGRQRLSELADGRGGGEDPNRTTAKKSRPLPIYSLYNRQPLVVLTAVERRAREGEGEERAWGDGTGLQSMISIL
jgi:hypothetical protein